MKKRYPFLLAVAVFFLLLSFASLKAANYTVVMGPSGLTFTPAAITVGQGDTVTWTNAASFQHTATSGAPAGTSDGLWDTGSMNGHTVKSVTFTDFATNTYPYYCTFHFTLGMVGSLTVTNGSPEPLPVLSNPVSTNGQFQFTINGPIGEKYDIQRSADLITWTDISTNLALSTSLNITDASATNAPVGSYRALELH
jgi:plastocyanin